MQRSYIHRSLGVIAIVGAMLATSALLLSCGGASTREAPQRGGDAGASADVPAAPDPSEQDAGKISMTLRTRIVAEDGSVTVVEDPLEIEPGKLAIVVVDIWTAHNCIGATDWPAKMIPEWNAFLDDARTLGIPIVFASAGDDLQRWQGKPQRTNITQLPEHPLPVSNDFLPGHSAFGVWPSNCMCPIKRINASTGEPIFDCQKQPGNVNQDPRIIVKDQDVFIAAGHYRPGIQWAVDSWGEPAQQELWNFVQEKGITHLLYIGDATNMCVINREFGMIVMKRAGLETILVRDLTNAMTYYGYNPETKQLDPDITPAVGTQKAVEYVEQVIGPSIDSGQISRATARVDASE